MTTADEPRELRMLVSSQTRDYGCSGDTLHFTVSLVYALPNGEIRNFVGGYLADENAMADLVVTAQHDRVDRAPYGWRVEYSQPHAVDLARAEVMVKVLRKVERGLARLQDELGYPETFAAYVARVGKVLGVKSYGMYSRGMLMDGTHYRWRGADYVSDLVRQACEEFTTTGRRAS